MKNDVQMFGELRLVRQTPPGASHQIESVLFTFERDTDQTVAYREQWTLPRGQDRWMCSRVVTVFQGNALTIDLASESLWDFPALPEGHEWNDTFMGHPAVSRKFFVPNWLSLPWEKETGQETS